MAVHLHPGDSFGPWLIDEAVGSGAFKTVYRARPGPTPAPLPEGLDSWPEIVALLIPNDQSPAGIGELEKEFRIARHMDHPGIPRNYAMLEHEGVHYIVTEFVKGESLRQRLKREQLLPQAEALRVVLHTAEALDHAHTHHVIHRDIKPENIVIGPEGRVWLLDFGVARQLSHTGQRAYTQTGTFHYMSPELISQGVATGQTDLWSLGAMLYELLTGIQPFTASTGQPLVENICAARWNDAPLFDRKVEKHLVRILRRLLEKDLDRRYAGALDLIRDIEAVCRQRRLVDDDEGRLEILIRASVPILYVLSHEEDCVMAALSGIAQRQAAESHRPRPLHIWSASQGLCDEQGRLVPTSTPTIGDPTVALEHVISSREDALYAFLDVHRHWTPEALLDLLSRLNGSGLSRLAFTGYALRELETQALAPAIMSRLDVLIAGRYVTTRHDGHGLLGSSNQRIHLLTQRHTQAEFNRIPGAEIIRRADGSLTLTGIAPVGRFNTDGKLEV